MSNETIFSLASAIAFFGWLGLIFLPTRWRYTWAAGLCASILAGMYSLLVFPALSGSSFMDFSSLEGVMKMMGNEDATLVGWIHYLAFDLLVGCVVARDGELLGISRWWLIPALLFCFMLGPVGWLLYGIIRLAARRKWGMPIFSRA